MLHDNKDTKGSYPASLMGVACLCTVALCNRPVPMQASARGMLGTFSFSSLMRISLRARMTRQSRHSVGSNGASGLAMDTGDCRDVQASVVVTALKEYTASHPGSVELPSAAAPPRQVRLRSQSLKQRLPAIC